MKVELNKVFTVNWYRVRIMNRKCSLTMEENIKKSQTNYQKTIRLN